MRMNVNVISIHHLYYGEISFLREMCTIIYLLFPLQMFYYYLALRWYRLL